MRSEITTFDSLVYSKNQQFFKKCRSAPFLLLRVCHGSRHRGGTRHYCMNGEREFQNMQSDGAPGAWGNILASLSKNSSTDLCVLVLVIKAVIVTYH